MRAAHLVCTATLPHVVAWLTTDVLQGHHQRSVSLTEARYRRKVGFVPQDDILHPDLTVR